MRRSLLGKRSRAPSFYPQRSSIVGLAEFRIISPIFKELADCLSLKQVLDDGNFNARSQLRRSFSVQFCETRLDQSEVFAFSSVIPHRHKPPHQVPSGRVSAVCPLAIGVLPETLHVVTLYKVENLFK